MSKELAQRFELGPDAQGVVITDVKGDSSAVEKGIRQGDVILEVKMAKVGKPAAVTAPVEEARKAGRRSVRPLTERGGDQDRKRVATGKRVSIQLNLGGGVYIK